MSSRETTRRVLRKDRWVQLVELDVLALKVTEGPDAGLTVRLSHPSVRIGTARDNDLVLTDPSVSRHHCCIQKTADGWTLTDLSTTNGTLVRGLLIKEVVLASPATIQLGDSILQLAESAAELCAIPEEGTEFAGLVGATPAMRELFALIRTIAPTHANVLIEAESGCGKEVLSRALHDLSGRTGRFVVFDCASTGAEMIRSELFGHLKGSFTGANDARAGAFRTGDRGTLFIDEIGELPLGLQPVLLRALEMREVTPLGADRPVLVDTRVIAATNRNLDQMVEKGQFRQDLFNRLATIRVRIPPLRERTEDLELLVAHFQRSLGARFSLSPKALEVLRDQDWPGNVRDVRNLVERLGILCADRVVEPDDLSRNTSAASERPQSETRSIRDSEAELIRNALRSANGNKAQAARLLGIDVTTLRRKLKRQGI
jgi:DNA-binding NtrC family response regulator